MTNAPPWKAIIFDFDGVLVDSVNVKTEAFRNLYKEESEATQQAVVDFHLEHGGLSRFEKIRHYETELLGRNPSQETLDQLAVRFADLVKESVIGAKEISGAGEVLDHFAPQLPLFVASGTPEIELIEIVERRGWSKYFRQLRGSPTHKSTLVCEIVDNHGLSAQECLMIGDAMTDYSAAVENGLQFVGITDCEGQHPFPDGTRVHDDLKPLLPPYSIGE